MKPKIYLDTSVIGGCFDQEFEKYSRLLFEAIKEQKYIAHISEITIDELIKAPIHIQAWFNSYKELFIQLPLTSEAMSLVSKYIFVGKFSNKTIADMRQIAIATVNNLDIVVSWNFKHIVNPYRLPVYNIINQENGYKPITITSPQKLLE